MVGRGESAGRLVTLFLSLGTLPGTPGAEYSRYLAQAERKSAPDPSESTRSLSASYRPRIVASLCLLASAFLLTLQQEWRGKDATLTRPRVYRVVREVLPP